MEDEIPYKRSLSDPAHIQEIGKYLKKQRLNQNKTQQTIADAAGINRITLVQIEKGKGGTMLTFIQILRALNQLHLLEVFETKPEISPIIMAREEEKMRKRANKKNYYTNTRKSSW
jgi:transcriptional regulator with XRE-family HTH domain